MKKFITALILLMTPCVQADVAVVVHPNNRLATREPREVQDIFLGRTRVFPGGKFALPVDQDSPLRAEFYQRLTGRPIEQINAYWARLMFTGQASPPLQLPNDAAVMETVRENEGAIGYIDPSQVDRRVRVLLLLK